ncbi:hypothetical protein CRT23_26765 [Methylobacterium sp. V23]|nr:hypothetical protein CRT23_26765 [Methylobacterium sp. V23]
MLLRHTALFAVTFLGLGSLLSHAQAAPVPSSPATSLIQPAQYGYGYDRYGDDDDYRPRVRRRFYDEGDRFSRTRVQDRYRRGAFGEVCRIRTVRRIDPETGEALVRTQRACR